MPEAPPHPARLPREALEAQTRFEAIKSAGPGGQHRNKVATGVRLTHLPTGIQGMATERRSQLENRLTALARLRLRLALDHRTLPRDADLRAGAHYIPSGEWRARVREERIRVNPSHEEFPALLAEALDRLHARQDDLEATARDFGVTRTQFVRFLALEPAALGMLNERRRARGERPLQGR